MDAATQSDNELMERFRSGDHFAFEVVFNRYYQRLCFFAFKLIDDRDQAEDVVSETVTKLWQRHANFESIMNVQAFLYITVKNHCLNLLKSEQFKAERKIELLHSLQHESKDDQSARTIMTELLQHVLHEIESFPERQKAIFKMYYFEDLSINEIAARLNVTPQTIKSHKFVAMEKLRKILGFKKDIKVAVLSFLFYTIVLLLPSH